MTSTSTDSGSAPRAGLLSRFVGIITSPGATFRSVVAYPTWLGILAVTILIVLVFAAGPMFTEWGRQAALDQSIQVMESFGRTVDDAMYAAMQRQMQFQGYITGVGILVWLPLFALLIAAVLFVIFGVAMGGSATFKQLYAVVVHSLVILALGAIFALPMNYARGSMSSSTNLAVLLPMLDENSFVARFLGVIDLFYVWWVVVLAIGIGVLYKRRTTSVAVWLFAVYGMIAICIALIRGMFGGSN